MRRSHSHGFTLVEMAIVLLILGVLTRSLLTPLLMVREQRQYDEAKRQLQDIKRSLTAYVIRNGVLPCPMLETTQPISSTQRNQMACTTSHGFLPAIKLSAAGSISPSGALLDPWGQPLRYVVSLADNTTSGNKQLPDWTSAGEPSHVGIRHLSADLQLCLVPASKVCESKNIRADGLAYVVVSHGLNRSNSLLQVENLDDDNVFIVSEFSSHHSNYFDDQLIWSSAQDVMYWMLRSGWLP